MTRIKAFWMGVREGYSSPDGDGWTWDGDPYHPLSVAYDHGRNVGEWFARIAGH
jgi:hypothetical protein